MFKSWMTPLVFMLCVLVLPIGQAMAGETAQNKPLGPGSKLNNVRVHFELDGKDNISFTKSYVLPQGRTSRRPDGSSMYVAKLQTSRVTLPDGRRFDVTPAIRVAIDKQGKQTVLMSMHYNNRQFGSAPLTDFLASITMTVGGRSQTTQHAMYTSCMDGATLVTMIDGSEVRIDSLVEGEFVLNPLTGASMEIARIIRGPEPYPLVRVGYGDQVVSLSTEHPVWTDRGFVMAKDLSVGDLLVDSASVAHPITVRETVPLNPDQIVYNLKFVGSSDRPEDHVFLAGGMAVGDLWLQDRLGGRQ